MVSINNILCKEKRKETGDVIFSYSTVQMLNDCIMKQEIKQIYIWGVLSYREPKTVVHVSDAIIGQRSLSSHYIYSEVFSLNQVEHPTTSNDNKNPPPRHIA